MVLDIVLKSHLKAFKNSLILTNTKNLTELAFFPMKDGICTSLQFCFVMQKCDHSIYNLNSKMQISESTVILIS